MADQHVYFVKVRGRTLGPFDTSRMCQMIQQGHIGRINQVSLDGNTWQNAGEFSQLFQLAEEVEEAILVKKHSTDTAMETSKQTPGKTPKNLSPEDRQLPALDQWYFGGARNPVGSVKSETIREMIRQGRLTAQDVVWRNGMTTWVAISQIPDFSQLVPTVPIAAETSKFCFACGAKIDQRAEICPKCGVRQHGTSQRTEGGTAWRGGEMTVLIILAFIIPLIGIVAGIIGLADDGKRSQGGVLIAISIAMIFVYLSVL